MDAAKVASYIVGIDMLNCSVLTEKQVGAVITYLYELAFIQGGASTHARKEIDVIREKFDIRFKK